jgi:RHS repeat-associated protein
VADGANWTCTTYDVRGRATQVVIPAVIGAVSRTVTSNYAVGGNPLVTSVTDPAGTITTTVDLLGRTTVYKDVFGTTTTSSYDQAGRVFKTVAVSAVNGSGVSSSQTQVQTFDSYGRPDALYLDPTNPASPDAAHKVAQVAYSASTGEVSSVSYPANGTGASYTYDPAGRQSAVGFTFPGANTVTDTVTFSQAGTIMTDTVSQTGQPGTFDNLAASSYGYDAAHRLVSATAGPSDNRHVYAYSYGAAAACTLPGALSNAAAGLDTNRTMLTDGKNGGAAAVTCYSYDKADRLTGTYLVVGGTPGAVNTYSYDAHGNDTNLKMPGAANGQALTYDSANRHMKTAADGTTSGVGNTSATYTRDATDRIVKRVGSSNIAGAGLESPATTVFYGFSGAGDTPDFTYATSGTGKTVVERMVPLPGGVTLTVSGNAAYVAGASGSTAVWGYGNLHGDTLLTTDKTGARAGVISLYEPFGTPLPTGSSASSTAAVLPNTNVGNYDAGWLGASGKQRFTEHAGTINTVEMGARQYSPTLGRFLQVDPIEGGSANDYDYVNADPIGALDLNGTYTQIYDLGKNDVSPAEATNLLLNNFGRLFPVAGAPSRITHSGQEFALLGFNRLRVEEIECTAFKFRALPGHIDSFGGTIRFSFYRSKGHLKMRIHGVQPKWHAAASFMAGGPLGVVGFYAGYYAFARTQWTMLANNMKRELN